MMDRVYSLFRILAALVFLLLLSFSVAIAAEDKKATGELSEEVTQLLESLSLLELEQVIEVLSSEPDPMGTPSPTTAAVNADPVSEMALSE